MTTITSAAKVKIVKRTPNMQAKTIDEILHKDIPYGWETVFDETRDVLRGISDAIGDVSIPKPVNVFEAFHQVPRWSVRAVIIGQDPYPGMLKNEPVATGMSFSTYPATPIQASMRNVIKEVQNNCPGTVIQHGSLVSWARQGVLLLNTSLTLTPGATAAMKKQAAAIWRPFIEHVLKSLDSNVIFIGWGVFARDLYQSIGVGPHVHVSGHPSPINTKKDFNGCNHFKIINDHLEERGEKPINWNVLM